MQFTDYYAAQSGLPVSEILALASFKFDGEVYSVVKWDSSLGAEPSPADLAAIAALPHPGPTQAQLQAYAGAKADGLVAALRSISADGVTLKSTSTDAAIGKINALSAWGAANPSASTIWTADDLSTVTITGAQIAGIAPLALAYSMSVYGAALPAVLAAIAAGTIATTAEIDAYAWPA